jgi:hypothetical protein
MTFSMNAKAWKVGGARQMVVVVLLPEHGLTDFYLVRVGLQDDDNLGHSAVDLGAQKL